MVCQRTLVLGEQGFTEAGIADQNDRIQLVSESAQVFFLVFVECHGAESISAIVGAWKFCGGDTVSKPRRSSGDWRERQERDPYVKRARAEGWRSRAVYKLEQIDQKERLLKPDMRVLDLGSAPGSWSQYVTEKLKGKATIVAVDLLEMDGLPGVDFILGDFRDEEILRLILHALADGPADLVMSDMAPNLSGARAVDQPRSMYLVELALEVCHRVLKPGGAFVCKLFQGEGADAFIAEARGSFEKLRVMKPEASRAGSREVYLIGRGFRPDPENVLPL